MRKVLSSVLIFALSLSLVGCSGTPSLNHQPNTPQQNQHQDKQSNQQSNTEQNKDNQYQNNQQQNNQELNNEQKTNTDSQETKIDTGRFSGRIDNNFIEIKISGVPDQIAAREFMLSEEMKASFDKINLKLNEEIKIRYQLNEHDQRVLIQIERL